MTDEWRLKRCLAKELDDGSWLEVEAGLHQLGWDQDPYWSVTCLLWEKRGNRSGKSRRKAGMECDGGGSMHDLIGREFPELFPVIAVHLADEHGVPIHAANNGWYFYSGQAREWEENSEFQVYGLNSDNRTDVERAAQALHIPAKRLRKGMSRVQFEQFVEKLKPWWQEMSDQARATLEAI